jgi:penicillin-binding protein 1C
MVLAAHAHAAPSPRFEEVKAAHAPSGPVLLDRRGMLLSAPGTDAPSRRPVWVGLRDLSPAMQSALIASEDRRFFAHRGVDWQAFVGALWDNLWRSAGGQRPRGASTLTMQLAGLLDPALQAKGTSRTLAQKWDQAVAAREIETRWTKQQIIEAYLNLATFRPGMPGVYAASIVLFGKHPRGLDVGEGLLLSALLRGPGAAPDKVAQRACAVARQVRAAPDCEALRALAAAALSGRGNAAKGQEDLAPHLARRLLAAPGMTITTTIDAELQGLARDALRRQLNGPAGRGLDDGAVMVLDNSSGEVLAYLGGSADASGVAVGDGITAPRQAGPLLVPFLYELAIGRRLLTAASMLDDSPATLSVAADSDIAQNTNRELRSR